MPQVQSVYSVDDLIELRDRLGLKQMRKVDVPQQFNTAQKLEDFLNSSWLSTNVTLYQVRVHVLSLTPMRMIVGTWDLGLAIPDNWWQDA